MRKWYSYDQYIKRSYGGSQMMIPKGNDIKIHKEADVMEEYDITELKASIAKHGLLQPILIWFDKSIGEWVVVDGKHRLKACNELGRSVITMKLSRKTKEEDLADVILTQQLLKRGLDEIIANCEAVLYLERVKRTVTNLLDEFSILKESKIKFLKTIRAVRPLWFTALRNGDYIKMDDGSVTKSLRTMYDICNKEKSGSSVADYDSGKGDKDVANAYNTMEPQVDAVIALIGSDHKKYYAFTQLMNQKCKIQQETYGVEKDVSQVLELEEKLKEQKDYNDILQTKVASNEAVITSLQSMIKPNYRNAMKMKKIISGKTKPPFVNSKSTL